MQRILAVLSFAFLLGACHTSLSSHRATEELVLLKAKNDAGDDVTYKLTASRDGKPALTRSRTQKSSVATLGLGVRSISREVGDSAALTPWRGVLVERVSEGTAAARAGILRGDVLLSIDGFALSTQEQLVDVIESYPGPDAEISIALLKVSADGTYPADPETVNVTLGSREVEVTKSDSFSIDSDHGNYHMTGMQVGTLSPELSLEVYGSKEPVTVIAGAVIGSPAYLAGLRKGDRVISCDGAPVSSYRDISRAVLARSESTRVPSDWFDQSIRNDHAQVEGDILLEVEGPLGSHQASVAVLNDLDDTSHFYVPILFDYHSDVDQTKWSFLDFIFQFGANYSGSYRRSSTREPETASLLSLLPLGMFEFESEPEFDRYCFFWFIEFKDEH